MREYGVLVVLVTETPYSLGRQANLW